MAMNAPFQWGSGGQKITPGQAKAMRDVAAAIAAKSQTPRNLGEGLASVGDALLYNSNVARAGEAESAGQAMVKQALAEARASGGSDGFLDVMGNEWATPNQQLVAGELYKQSRPDWQTMQQGGDIVRWNGNDPNASPELWYDGPDEAANSVTYGVTPIWGQDTETDAWGYVVQGSDGSSKRVDTGAFQPADPRTINTERAIGTTVGKGQGERELQAPMAQVGLEQMNAKTDNVISTIDEALEDAGGGETGLVGSIMGNVPGTKAYDLRSTITTVKANLGFAELQAMRDASPTGGALGQVAVQELEALQSAVANLDANQSEDQLRGNLQLVKQLLDRQKMYRQMSMEAKFSAPGEGAPQQPGGDVDAILTGMGIN